MSNDDTEIRTPEGLRRAYDSSRQAATAAEQRAEAAERELMFHRAGINVESAVGKLLVAGYKGNDVEELRTMAVEVGALPSPSAAGQQQEAQQQAAPGQSAIQPAPGATTVTTQPGLPDDWEQRAEMQRLARSGQSHGGAEAPTPHPMEQSLEGFFSDLKSGMEPQEAQLKAMGNYLQAAGRGDKRTVFDAQAHRERALLAER